MLLDSKIYHGIIDTAALRPSSMGGNCNPELTLNPQESVGWPDSRSPSRVIQPPAEVEARSCKPLGLPSTLPGRLVENQASFHMGLPGLCQNVVAIAH